MPLLHHGGPSMACIDRCRIPTTRPENHLSLKEDKEMELTVFGPIPLNRESSFFTSSTDSSRRYSRQILPLRSLTSLSMDRILAAFVAARPPHRMASSNLFPSSSTTWSQEGKAALSEAKARREMASVVFWERSVVTRPSSTVGDEGRGSRLGERPPRRRTRKAANSSGNPWNARRASRTTRHCAEQGEAWEG
uniref:Uncharacterized protein n=1 Tax=Zea mays TaxID=4577 RepID=B8A1I6_MAIZE|nr:unknown [Zea mays]